MKVAVIGAGAVGAMVAMRIVEADLADVVLVDIAKGLSCAKALDLAQGAGLAGTSRRVVGGDDYSKIKDSEVVVLSAGLPRKPGMSREDLVEKNAKIVKAVISKIVKFAQDSIILMVTNPLDVMTYLAYKLSGFRPQRVFGVAGLLDSARFNYLLADELKIRPADVSSLVLGGHGDSMVVLPRFTTANNRPITELLSKEKIDQLVERTRKGGSEIVAGLGEGSAFFAPSASAYTMVRSILLDEKKIIPCSVWLQGQYGLSNLCLGVPARIGRDGVEEIISLDLNRAELDALHRSAQITRESINKMLPSL